MKLLHIDSSITGSNSVTRQLSAETVAAWVAAHPGTTVDYLDVTVNTPPHLTADALGFRTGQAAQTEAERAQNAISEAFVTQFLAADVVVIGAPFYNFSIPSQLKSWFDRVMQAGRTFQYTAAGPQGLVGDKEVIVVEGRGGIYSTSDAGRAMEHQETYLQALFGFMGVKNVKFVRAEGVAMGADPKTAALQNARADIAQLIAASKKAA